EVLVSDGGCEYGYQASDITRTFPVNGRFTAPQRAIYDIVLRAQLAGIAAAKPGQRYEEVHDAARRVLTEGLVALGLLPRGVEESLAMHHYREFYMHGTGHWLGLDGHDGGDYRVRRGPRGLAPSRARHGVHRRARPLLRPGPRVGHLLPAGVQRAGDARAPPAVGRGRRPAAGRRREGEGGKDRPPDSARVPRYRREDRGRRPHHRVRPRRADRRRPQDDRGSRAGLRRGPPPAALGKGLSFDVYRTLVDVRAGSHAAFADILSSVGAPHLDPMEFWERWEAANIRRYWQPYRAYREICRDSLAETFAHFGIRGDAGLIQKYFDAFPTF